jgi:hypothetical protein
MTDSNEGVSNEGGFLAQEISFGILGFNLSPQHMLRILAGTK